MRVLPLPAGQSITTAVRDPATAHPELRRRLAVFELKLAKRGMNYLEGEFYRYDARQAWLYGSGRTALQMRMRGLSEAFARPNERIVTDAWSATVGAHGWTMQDSGGLWIPAAAAVDLIPTGKDGKPWTPDDPWDEFCAICEEEATPLGLVHFRRKGVLTDKPHLQMREWNDATHQLDWNPSPPVAA